jgi:HEAT repeat protein
MQTWWKIPTSARLIAAAILLLANPSILLAQSADELIDRLGSSDPAVRQEAELSLGRLGPAARERLRRARHHPIPEIAARAANLLGRLPLYLPSDPPEVKAVLFDYEIDDREGRERRIKRLRAIAGPAARLALLRIASDEPVRALQWRAVAGLSRSEDPATLEAMRQLQDENEPCQLILAAWGWKDIDAQRSAALAQKAIELDPAAATVSAGIASAD